MAMNPRRYILLMIIVLAIALAWGLWPLNNPKYNIYDDQAMLAARNAYLRTPAGEPSPATPNVVLILADDLGKTDISLYGGNTVDTPRIDSIGRDGITFSEGYVTAPVCSPSRAGLLTGRYQQRFGFEILCHDRYACNRVQYLAFKHFVAKSPWILSELAAPTKEALDRQGIPASEITMADMMRKHGYATGIFGKWHLGYHDQVAPAHRGFDFSYEFRGGFTMYDYEDDPDVVNHPHDDFTEPFIWKRARNGASAIRRNLKEIREDEYLTDAIAREANDWIKDHKDAPFFAYVPFLAPHTPFQATKKQFARFAHIKDHNKRVYYAMIASLDEAVGSILRTLEETGVADNTLVIFLSDNGGATYTKATENAPLKGGKFSNFEGGINVPFMMRWPNQLDKGTLFTEPVMSTDIFATLAKLVGASLPTDRHYDGVDLMPYFTGSKQGPPHEALCWRSGGHKAIRKNQYKLVTDTRTGALVLYDLSTDKNETLNIAASQPDTVKALLAELTQWEKQLKNPMWPPVAEFAFADGDMKYRFPL